MEKPLEKPFDPPSLPRKPLVLTLPLTGKVEVHVVGPGGPPADGTVSIGLSVDNEGGHKPFPFSKLSAPVKGGKAVFPFVGLGLYLRIYPELNATSFGREPPPPAAEGPGPTVPGGTAVFRIFLPRGVAVLEGRVLLPSGKPVTKKTLKKITRMYNKDGSPAMTSWTSLRTDGKGNFRLFFPSGKPKRKRTVKILLPFGKTGGMMKAVIDLSRSFPPGRTNLGDIRLPPPPSWPPEWLRRPPAAQSRTRESWPR